MVLRIFHSINNYVTILLLAGIQFLNACSTDVDLNEEWEYISLVYCILNYTDTAHYVRIQRAYLGEGNMLHFASEHDSIYYTDDITVNIEEWNDNILERIINFETTPEIHKDSGLFAYEDHFLFKSSASIDPDFSYELVVNIPSQNKTLQASTNIIGEFDLDDEIHTYFDNTINFSTNNSFPVGWHTPRYGKIYELKLIFHFIEVIDLDSTNKYIEWTFPTTYSYHTTGDEHIFFYTHNAEFYQFVASSLNELPGWYDKRIAQNIDLIFNVGTDELYTYIELTKPASGYLSDLPVYSNITNGYGIFTSRVDQLFHLRSLDGGSTDSLACGIYTRHLNFVDRYGNLHACD